MKRHEGCEVGKRVVAGPQLLEAREIKCVAGIPGLGGRAGHSCRIEMDQLAGIRHRQESQQGGVHHAEHGGVGADAERQRTTATAVKPGFFVSIRKPYRRS